MLVFKKLLLFFLAICSIALFYGCEKKKNKFPDSDMYDFSSPKVVTLPEELDEISGIAYYPKDTSVFAIIDEDGVLFKIPLRNPKALRQWKFDKKRDFEELVMIDSVFYALVSNGDVESIHFNGQTINTEKSNFSDQNKSVNEFESMFRENDSSRLIILCKSCEGDPKKSFSSLAYNYKDTSNSYVSYINFDMSVLESKLNVDKHLKASAAAINPITKDIYIISSIQQLLVITNSKGEFKELYKLNPAIYKQPEGLTFTPSGDLIISNEFAQDGFANLLLLKNKKKER
ncbi:MAG: SdiA-regulated domain-containing protein [Ferruginibacter sp.]